RCAVDVYVVRHRAWSSWRESRLESDVLVQCQCERQVRERLDTPVLSSLRANPSYLLADFGSAAYLADCAVTPHDGTSEFDGRSALQGRIDRRTHCDNVTARGSLE